MFIDITEQAINWYFPLAEMIHRYDLKIKLDHTGIGNCIFYKDEEIGYFVEWAYDSIDLHFVNDYGIKFETYSNWKEVKNRLEGVINEIGV